MTLSVDLETRIEQLDSRLLALESRLARIEHSGAAPLPATEIPPAQPLAAAPLMIPDTRADIALAGRSLLGLGGAYLLRALTESGAIPHLAGLVLGLAYAALWIYFAFRQSWRHDAHAATASSMVAALVAYPLIWEATARFGTFTIETACFLMLALSTALLAVAWRHDFATAAWIATIGSIVCAAGLALAAQDVSVPLLAFSIFGALTWHIASAKHWFVRWPALVPAWIAAVALQLTTAVNRGRDAMDFAAVALLISAFAYLGAIAAKNLIARDDITWYDVAQAFGTIAFVLSGAAWIGALSHSLLLPIMMAIATVAAGAYFTALRQTPADIVAPHYFGALAVACTVFATVMVATPTVAGMVWIAFATICIFAARALRTSQFVAHAVVYSIAGAIATGLLGGAVGAITGMGKRPPIALAPGVATAGIAVAAITALLVRENASKTWRIGRLVLFTLAALVVIAGATLIILRVGGTDAAASAAVRSAVIAIAAVSLAFLTRLPLFSFASILVYPVLGVGAAKFVIDDFMNGRAVTLFVSLAVYGCALLVLAKMRRTTVEGDAAVASS